MNTQNTSWLYFGMSILTHVFLLIPAVYIVVLAVGTNYSLFIWHPTCLAVGCGLLMTEAIIGVSAEASPASKFSRAGRIRTHWVLHCLGLALLVIGFGVIVANKNRNSANHFTSDHGRLGLSTFIISLIVAFGGFLTLYSGLLRERMSLASIKLIHSCCGIICTILLLTTLITGLYRWWPSTSGGRSFVVASYVIGGCLLLVKPVYRAGLKICELFK